MNTFYNPYHFVPVAARQQAQNRYDLPVDKLGTQDAGATTHERYLAGHHSGWLECTLETVTPLVIGAEQRETDQGAKCVNPYMEPARDGREERPAIPALSLRGLISSLAEAASNSALRVLGNESYSYRKSMRQALSALGLIIRDESSNELQIKPVALPTLELSYVVGPGTSATNTGFYYEVPDGFASIFPRPAFKVYVGDKYSIRTNKMQRSSSNAPLKVRSISYTEGPNGKKYIVEHFDRKVLYLKGGKPPYLQVVAQLEAHDSNVLSTPGLLRVLGCWPPRTEHIPPTKKHELWLPAPGDDVASCPIAQQVIDRFHHLADERTEASTTSEPVDPLLVLPFHPLDTLRNPDSSENKFRLKPGDLVYFDVDEHGTVTEIALAAIWRGQVTEDDGSPAGAHAFFDAVDSDLVPLTTASGRKCLTIAEQMFGFVEERQRTDPKVERPAAGLASRIRFSNGLLGDGVSAADVLEDRALLRILGSPKPPSPALYFKPSNGQQGYIAKADLRPQAHHPQGRKMYLHHRVEEGARPWETAPEHAEDDLKQKSWVRPVRAKQTFSFHIDYENLTDDELGLLLYALAPDASFHHKLGMGKPLGLGSVKINVLFNHVIDRSARYTLGGLRSKLRALKEDWSSLQQHRDGVISSGLVSRDIHDAICLLGDYAPETAQVQTPTITDEDDLEVNTYRWFVANDVGIKEENRETRPQDRRQSLAPLPNRDPQHAKGRLPTLRRPLWQPRQRNQ